MNAAGKTHKLLLIHDKLTQLLICRRRVAQINPKLILRQSQINGEAQNISYFIHPLTTVGLVSI